MAYVIGLPCVDVKDRACVEECPTLAGQAAPLGSPGGAGKIGPLEADTPLVAGLPLQDGAGH